MWLKIVAGLAAALAVVTVGVFVAMPPTEGGCGKCRAPALESDGGSTSEVSGSMGCPTGPPLPVESTTSVAPCCNNCVTKTVDSNALAACAGGMAVKPAPTAAKFHCCDE